MKKFLLFISVSLAAINMQAQNVGIGTNNPTKKLSVNGSIVVDHDEENSGSLDSAGLLFGKTAITGIISKKQGFDNLNGLDFIAGGVRRFAIGSNGALAIGGNPDAAYKLLINGKMKSVGKFQADDDVYVGGNAGIGIDADAAYRLLVSGNSRVIGDGSITGALNVGGTIFSSASISATGNISTFGNLNASGNASIQGLLTGTSIRAVERAAIGGVVDNNFRLRVYDGDSRFGGSVEATGNMTIGGALDNTYKLRVIGGNSRFGGDAQVTGTLDVGSNIDLTGQLNAGSVNTGALVIGGKGSVRSNGTSPLRIGFDSKAIDDAIAAGDTEYYTANITDFTGSSDDVRVIVSHYDKDITSSAEGWEKINIGISNINANTDTCIIRLYNPTGGVLIIKGTIYLTSIAKN